MSILRCYLYVLQKMTLAERDVCEWVGDAVMQEWVLRHLLDAVDGSFFLRYVMILCRLNIFNSCRVASWDSSAQSSHLLRLRDAIVSNSNLAQAFDFLLPDHPANAQQRKQCATLLTRSGKYKV